MDILRIYQNPILGMPRHVSGNYNLHLFEYTEGENVTTVYVLAGRFILPLVPYEVKMVTSGVLLGIKLGIVYTKVQPFRRLGNVIHRLSKKGTPSLSSPAAEIMADLTLDSNSSKPHWTSAVSQTLTTNCFTQAICLALFQTGLCVTKDKISGDSGSITLKNNPGLNANPPQFNQLVLIQHYSPEIQAFLDSYFKPYTLLEKHITLFFDPVVIPQSRVCVKSVHSKDIQDFLDENFGCYSIIAEYGEKLIQSKYMAGFLKRTLINALGLFLFSNVKL